MQYSYNPHEGPSVEKPFRARLTVFIIWSPNILPDWSQLRLKILEGGLSKEGIMYLKKYTPQNTLYTENGWIISKIRLVISMWIVKYVIIIL